MENEYFDRDWRLFTIPSIVEKIHWWEFWDLLLVQKLNSLLGLRNLTNFKHPLLIYFCNFVTSNIYFVIDKWSLVMRWILLMSLFIRKLFIIRQVGYSGHSNFKSDHEIYVAKKQHAWRTKTFFFLHIFILIWKSLVCRTSNS